MDNAAIQKGMVSEVDSVDEAVDEVVDVVVVDIVVDIMVMDAVKIVAKTRTPMTHPVTNLAIRKVKVINQFYIL